MADKKKDAPAPRKIHPAEPVIVMFFVVAILGAVAIRFREFLAKHLGLSGFLETLWLFIQGKVSFAELVGSTNSEFLVSAIFFFKIFSFGFSIFMVWAIIYTYRKANAAHSKLMAPLKPPAEIKYGVFETSEALVNPKWARVLEHVNSENPSDWKLGILEADIMLGEALDKMGYRGATIGDKLKSIEPSDFTNLQEAWEAHKVRNSIAHEGSDYTVNKPEAERVIRLFKKVFEEFKYI